MRPLDQFLTLNDLLAYYGKNPDLLAKTEIPPQTTGESEPNPFRQALRAILTGNKVTRTPEFDIKADLEDPLIRQLSDTMSIESYTISQTDLDLFSDTVPGLVTLFKQNTQLFAPLTREGTLALFEHLQQTKDENEKKYYRDLILFHSLRLISFAIKRFLKDSTLTQEEILSEGLQILYKAIDAFKLDRETTFSTYAVKSLVLSIRKYERSKNVSDHDDASLEEEDEQGENLHDKIYSWVLSPEKQVELNDEIYFLNRLLKDGKLGIHPRGIMAFKLSNGFWLDKSDLSWLKQKYEHNKRLLGSTDKYSKFRNTLLPKLEKILQAYEEDLQPAELHSLDITFTYTEIGTLYEVSGEQVRLYLQEAIIKITQELPAIKKFLR